MGNTETRQFHIIAFCRFSSGSAHVSAHRPLVGIPMKSGVRNSGGSPSLFQASHFGFRVSGCFRISGLWNGLTALAGTLGSKTWDVVPGWYEAAPLALGNRILKRSSTVPLGRSALQRLESAVETAGYCRSVPIGTGFPGARKNCGWLCATSKFQSAVARGRFTPISRVCSVNVPFSFARRTVR